MKQQCALGSLVVCGFACVLSAQPEYQIYDIGIVQTSDFGSQAFGVSPSGIVTGRSLGSPTHAWSWTEVGGRVDLPNLASPVRAFSVGNGVNDAGVVVGVGSTTAFGSDPLPLMWENGVVSVLPLPVTETLGRAYDINSLGVAVGSVNGGSLERGAIFNVPVPSVITQTTTNGSYMQVAYGINDAGLIVGTGFDPNNAAINAGVAFDMNTLSAFLIPALSGDNSVICFAVGNGGHVVGSSSFNQANGKPFIWTQTTGSLAIPLPVGTSQGSARGVNANGWAVGTASNAFAIPFLFDGTQTYLVADLLPAGSGWDLSMNTSSSAMGISDDGIIVGTGVHNSNTRAYAMVPTTSCYADCDGSGTLNIFDYICFGNEYASGSQYADCDGSGSLNIFDYICFGNAYAGGCP
ncbi:MAG: hypothetical protein H6815_05455 [Phycisphaeraceae bacterium]|nr:hypothetical protein [Phycisphaerales bacterium]MCB9859884.1 hypothetical protein [Phycisphaeraceae bacterium]